MLQELTIVDALNLLKDKITLTRFMKVNMYLVHFVATVITLHGHLYVNSVTGLMNCYRCEIKGR